MSMFRIECLVRGTKLAETLLALDGLVANLDVRPVRMNGATAPKPEEWAPRKRRVVKSTPVRQRVLDTIGALPDEFRLVELRRLIPGVSHTAVYGALRELIASNSLVQRSKGHYIKQGRAA